ncbi:MAG: hypothetical protein BroJett040_00540 [Oligoflexia bacterium]|nr:MAG: hypothetical protein BroJett040_00540 [Oligoflexia bacterium]
MKLLKNTTKVWFFLIGVSLVLMFGGYQIGQRLGLFIGLLLAILFHSLLFFFGENQLLKSMKARPLEGQDPWGLLDLVRHYTDQLSMAPPALFLMDHRGATAFSFMTNTGKGAICLSTGLLQKLRPEEIEAIVAHQVSHVHRLDTFGFGLSHLVAHAIIGFGNILDHMWPPNVIARQINHHPFLNLLSPLAWLILRIAISEKVFFETDDLAITLLKDRRTLAEAIWKLDGLSQAIPLRIPPVTAHFFIVNPQGPTVKNWLLLTHPNIENRIKRLIGYFPI